MKLVVIAAGSGPVAFAVALGTAIDSGTASDCLPAVAVVLVQEDL